MPIELRVHDPDYGQSVAYNEMTVFLAALPDVRAEGGDYTFRDEEAGIFYVAIPGHVERGADAGAPALLGPDAAGRCNNVTVRIPDPTPATREPVTEFCYHLASRFGWQVFEGANPTPVPTEPELLRRLSAIDGPLRAPGGCMSVVALFAVALTLAIMLAR